MRTRHRASLVALVLVTILAPRIASGQNDEVRVRVVDVGPGLCTVTRIPGGHYMVYDAGHWNGRHCVTAVSELLDGSDIDLLVLSHNDSDHIGDGARILQSFNVHRILWTGDRRGDTQTWLQLNDAIAEEVRGIGASVQTLSTVPLIFGDSIRLGEAVVRLVAGWGTWTESGPTASERRNVISIVARLDFGSSSILYTGDTIGRRLGDDSASCKDAEKFMAENHDAGAVRIDVDVLIAPHHGGNNGSSKCFIERAKPQFVIFSAGHQHQHPTAAVAQRYIASGVAVANIFRTDRGDDEIGEFEWKTGTTQPGCKARAGNDDIEIELPRSGTPRVRYLKGQSGC